MKEKVIFSIINETRVPEYQVITKIIKKNNGDVCVRKYPVYDSGRKHLDNLFDSYNILKNIYKDSMIICPVEQKEDYLEFEYIDSATVYTRLFLDVIKSNNKQQFFKTLDEYLALIFDNKDNKKIDFYFTEEFEKLFGKLDDLILTDNIQSLQVTPFDIIVNNLLIKDNQVYCIDYEWVFTFPVPVDLFYFHLIWQLNSVCCFENIISFQEVYDRFNPSISMDSVTKYYQNFMGAIGTLTYFDIGKNYIKNQVSMEYLLTSQEREQELLQAVDYHQKIDAMNNERIKGLESSESYYKGREQELLQAVDYHQKIDAMNNERIKGLESSESYYKGREQELLQVINDVGFIFVIKKYIRKIIKCLIRKGY